MLEHVIGSFVGAFAALVVLAEVGPIQNRWLRYLAALLLGALLAIILALILGWMVSTLVRAT